jgi:hypothetical protein
MILKKVYNKYINKSINNYKSSKKFKSLFTVGFKSALKSKSFDIINCGAQRSGSTLLNLIIEEILKGKLNCSNEFCNTEEDYISTIIPDGTLGLIKTHNFSHLISKRIEKKKSIGFFTHRDIRDVIVSHIQKGWISGYNQFFESGKYRYYLYNSILYSETNNIINIEYEDLITKKQKTIELVAKNLGYSLSDSEINAINEVTSVKNIKSKISQFEFDSVKDNLVNADTNLHSNHINDPTSGKWRDFFNAEEIKDINMKACQYLKYFNYNL